MKTTIIHFGDISGWKRFADTESFCIHQAIYKVSNDIVFIPYLEEENLSLKHTVAIFKIKKYKAI